MLHVNDPIVRSLLLKGSFGLEKESLRITGDGHFAHTPDPFTHKKHIVRDFCENQTEINTDPVPSPKKAVAELERYTKQIQKTLAALPEPEYLWPFSNPPYIRNEEDIPVAQYYGDAAYKTEYRQYLSHRYGRYKMAFSGIHFNYSFADELLRADFALSEETDFVKYKGDLYVTLAERLAAYGWLMVAITAASPLLDSSYVSKGQYDTNLFNGMATTRCSELGYWNYFTPVFDYTDAKSYAESILQYVDDGLIRYPSELYYPVRVKPVGAYDMKALRDNGQVSHIELRMLDLNPLTVSGIEEKDVFFAQLMLVWLAGTPRQKFDLKDQVQAVQNFKNAARFDLKTVSIVVPNGERYSVVDAALNVIGFMEEFYRGFPDDVQEILAFEKEKFLDPEKRYAWKIKNEFKDGYVKNGLALAKQRQQELIAD